MTDEKGPLRHHKIHSVITERELKQHVNFEKALENEHIQKFIKWIRTKDIEFYEKTKLTKKRRNGRNT